MTTEIEVTEEMVEVALEAFNAAINEPQMVPCEKCGGRGYHHGFGDDGADPDWCTECGGNQFIIAPGEEARAMRAALEAVSRRAAPEPADDALHFANGVRARPSLPAPDRAAVIEECANVAEREAESQAASHMEAIELVGPTQRLGRRIARAIRALKDRRALLGETEDG